MMPYTIKRTVVQGKCKDVKYSITGQVTITDFEGHCQYMHVI